VGNGTRLVIKNIGISKLSPLFTLRHVLHVPKITKNLISIQKFTADNNVFIEFHPSCFFVKDHMSGKILHQGPSRNGLYHWFLMYKLNVLASARVVCNIMGVQVRGRSHREFCS
jgi:hypothetical protein